MTSPGKFIFIESNTSGTGELLICKANDRKLTSVLITSDPNKYSFLPLVNILVIVIDTSNRKLLLECLSEIDGIKGIYSSSEYYVETAAWLAKNLGLLGTDPQSIKLCRDKYSMYSVLSASEIDCPKTAYASNMNQAEKIIASFVFPAIVKPNFGSGSIGVKLCKNKEDALSHIDILFQKCYSEILVQEYIDGQEFSVEVCSFKNQHHVMGITRKYISRPPNFIETGHDFPATLKKDDSEKLSNVVVKLLDILGFDFGFSHIELKIKAKKVFIIEINPRLAGGMIPILIEKAKGLDVLDSLISLYLGHAVNIDIPCHKFASIRHFVETKTGTIKGFKFDYTGLIDVKKFIKSSGEYFVPNGDFQDRLAYIIVSDMDAEQCKNRADEAIKHLSVSIEV